MCHEVYVGKTGCLTTGNMEVSKYQVTLGEVNDQVNDSDLRDSFSAHLVVNTEIKSIIEECIISNTDVYITENDTDNCYEP